MDFDFNIILVPVTVFLGLIWLLDKLWWKRYQSDSKVESTAQSKAPAKMKVAKQNLQAQQTQLKEVLSKHDIEFDDIDSFMLKDSTDNTAIPAQVKRAYADYRDAKRQANLVNSHTTKPKAPLLIRLAYDFFPVLLIVLIVRSFIAEPFNIPSSSMVPSLYTGDFIAVNKYAYGLRLPLSYHKVIDIGNPERGDVVVFRYPEDPKIYFIKRVVGLPGDTVKFTNGTLSINGNTVPSEPVDFTVDKELTDRIYTPIKDKDGRWKDGLSPELAIARARKEEGMAKYFQEQLGDHTYLRRYLYDKNQHGYSAGFSKKLIPSDGGWEVKVPENSYFVMGDNSDNSGDSRIWGFVPDDHLAGKAVYIWMHKKPGLNFPTFSRNGTID